MNGKSAMSAELTGALPVQARAENAQGQSPKGAKASRACYSDMQSAARFPIKLPISVKSQGGGESLTETENISANGVLFQVDAEMPVGSAVDFTISLPADVVGAGTDVRLECRGRVVRSEQENGRRGVGVVIDEYHFDQHS
jgi:hypothetical protein